MSLSLNTSRGQGGKLDVGGGVSPVKQNSPVYEMAPLLSAF